MEDESLSGLWRKNSSKDAGTELASILDSARVIAQTLLPDTQVVFAGVDTAATDMKRIFLPAKDIGKVFPVPGDIVDRILGVTVHEIGHRLFSEDKPAYQNKVYNTIGPRRMSMSGTSIRYLNGIIDVLEDIYVDHVMTAYPGYHDYLERERAGCLADIDVGMATKPLTVQCDRNDMLNCMIYFGLLGGQLPDDITMPNLDIVGKLLDIIGKMVTNRMSKIQAAVDVYDILTKLPEFIDHNKDGLMDKVKQEQKSGQPEQTPPSDSGNAKGEDSDKKPEKPAKEKKEPKPKPEKPDKPEDEPASGDDSDEDADDGESDDESNETGEGESENDEPKDTETEDESEKGEPDNGEAGDKKPEESDTDSPEEDNDGEGNDSEESEPNDDDGNTGELEETEGQPPDGDTEPKPTEPEPVKWQPVDLASKLDNNVNDKSKLTSALAKQVSDAIIEKRADLSQLVSYLAKESGGTILAYTPDEGAEVVAEARSHTAEAEEKLRRILQDFRTKRTKDFRGLLSGRVSARRLYRVAYGDQRVFQRRERPEEIDMVVCLLMDLSSSMAGDAELIEQVVCAITDAFTKEKLEFIALGYSNNGNKVMVPRLYDQETAKVRLNLAGTWGSTPSYEGLAVAIAQLLRLGGTKKKVLFHFTDGVPNSGRSVEIPELLKQAKEKGIIAIHVGIGAGDSIKYVYGDDALNIDDINSLPEVVDTVLREKLGDIL